MNIRLQMTAVLIVSVFIMLSCRQQPQVVNEGLRYSESVCAYADTLLIANFGSDELNPLTTPDSAGYIMQMVDGEMSVFYPADGTMSAPKGMAVAGDYLYVADVRRVHVVNLRTRRKYVLPLPSEDAFANHMAVVGDMLLLSVTNNGHILALDLRDDGSPHMSGFQLLATIPGANGLCYSGGRLYVASYNPAGEPTEENVIYVIDDFDKPYNFTKFLSRPGMYDGLAVHNGYLYFTDWTGPAVGKVSVADSSEVKLLDIELEQPLEGPAQIGFFDDKLVIPDLPNSRLVLY